MFLGQLVNSFQLKIMRSLIIYLVVDIYKQLIQSEVVSWERFKNLVHFLWNERVGESLIVKSDCILSNTWQYILINEHILP